MIFLKEQKKGFKAPPLSRMLLRSRQKQRTSVCNGHARFIGSVPVPLAFDGFAVCDAVATGGFLHVVTNQL